MKLLEDEMEALLEQDSLEKLTELWWTMREKVFGKPPTFVSKEGVFYFRGPQEIRVRTQHEKEWMAFEEWKNNPQRLEELKHGVDPLKAEEGMYERQELELKWARKRDKECRMSRKVPKE